MTPERFSPEWLECVFPAHYLRERFDYDPGTGLLTWRDCYERSRQWRSKMAGKPALNSPIPTGYLRGCIDGVHLLAHRVAWVIQTGCWPVLQIDHINRVRSDNRFANLREVTHSDNQRNLRPEGSGGALALGVVLTRSGRCQASISFDGKSHHLGCFADPEDAVAARYQAEIAYGWPARAETLEQAQAAARAAWLARSS